MKLGLGKFRDTEIKYVPKNYLKWVIENVNISDKARDEIERTVNNSFSKVVSKPTKDLPFSQWPEGYKKKRFVEWIVNKGYDTNEDAPLICWKIFSGDKYDERAEELYKAFEEEMEGGL